MSEADQYRLDTRSPRKGREDGAASNGLELTILMPCLNEAETLGRCLTKAQSFLDRTGIRGEILVADNGSTDGSPEIARQLGARIVNIDTQGYGAALLGGIRAARGKFVIMADSDDSYDFSKLDNFVESLRDGADLVMGNRFRGDISKGAMPALHRYVGNPVLSYIGRLFYRSPVGDFHCGLRGFRRDIIDDLQLASKGMEFASEMVVKATLGGLHIREVPTSLSPDGRSRAPHLRSWRDGWRHLKLLLMFAPDWLFLFPGALFFLTGFFLVSLLSLGPVAFGQIRLDIASLILGLASLLTGSQLLSYYLLAHRHAVNIGILPRSARFSHMEAFLTVEKACTIGAILLAFGLISAASAVIIWIGQDFGDLNPSRIVRPVSWSVLGFSLGLQAITTGFLWETIGRSRLDRQPDRT